MIRFSSCCVLLALLFAGRIPDVQAQALTEPPPRIEQAEATFDQALASFEAEDYGMAYRRFQLVYNDFPLHRKTTAAILMAAKALYRDGEYEQAADLLARFIEQYPTSSYIGEARITRDLALQGLAKDDRMVQPLRLGIALPDTREDAEYTQALFNGIRLAVDEFNAAGQYGATVRMYFRDTENDPQEAGRAITELARADSVDVIIGPLFSEEAEAGAEAADREGVVLVPPLATEENVGEGHRYVFQANPSITARGRVMARYAVRDLRLTRFGIVTEPGSQSISARMGEGFQDEALRLGAEVAFFEQLPSARSWQYLSSELERDTLRTIEALYLPVDGRDAATLVNGALGEIYRMQIPLHILGNSRWDAVTDRERASDYYVTYTSEFFISPTSDAAQNFRRRYRALASAIPDRLAYVGYDVARFVLQQLIESEEAGMSLRQTIEEAPPYEGLGTRIDFQGQHVNQALFLFGYREGKAVLLN